jgi:hypothetical protein
MIVMFNKSCQIKSIEKVIVFETSWLSTDVASVSELVSASTNSFQLDSQN